MNEPPEQTRLAKLYHLIVQAVSWGIIAAFIMLYFGLSIIEGIAALQQY